MGPEKSKTLKNIETTIHKKDRRANIPTEELRDFVAEDEARPKTILYPRASSLDPQLVWKGKDEQDSGCLHRQGDGKPQAGIEAELIGGCLQPHRASRLLVEGNEDEHSVRVCVWGGVPGYRSSKGA